MSNNRQPGSQDSKPKTKPKIDFKRFNDPCLPNGEKPDFGNGSKQRNNRPRNQSQPQQRPKGQQIQQGQQGQQQSKKNPRNKQKSAGGNNGNRSPLNSPQLLQKSPVINNGSNYKLSGPSPNSVPTTSIKPYKPTNYAGPTFHNSPETKSLPKPSFL